MSTVTPYLLYEDAAAAVEWLIATFGFRERLRYTEPTGRVTHAELTFADGVVMLGEPGKGYENPKRASHFNGMVVVEVEDLDAHHTMAVSGGATIVTEPEDTPYGIRRYRAADPEGHEWEFTQTVADVQPEDWGATVAS